MDPADEAEQVAVGLTQAGWTPTGRVTGASFVALAFENAARGETTVRVITRRGIGLAMDVPGEESAEPVGLVADAGGDVDGDGREELFLWRSDPLHERRCHAAVRIDAQGFVTPVAADLGPYGPDACIEELRDLDGDAAPEALVVWRFPDLSRGSIPGVLVPLSLDAAGWRARRAGLDAFFAAERERRDRAISDARAARDLGRAYVLAVEVAAIERVRGAPMRAQVVAFDEALSGLVLTEPDARALAEARDHIAGGW